MSCRPYGPRCLRDDLLPDLTVGAIGFRRFAPRSVPRVEWLIHLLTQVVSDLMPHRSRFPASANL